jgi:hypothetical protein
MAGTGFMDMGTGMTLGTKKAIGIRTRDTRIRTRDTRIRVPGGFSVPVSNTTNGGSNVRQAHQQDSLAQNGMHLSKAKRSTLTPSSLLSSPPHPQH